jgi:hypothetical protein
VQHVSRRVLQPKQLRDELVRARVEVEDPWGGRRDPYLAPEIHSITMEPCMKSREAISSTTQSLERLDGEAPAVLTSWRWMNSVDVRRGHHTAPRCSSCAA